MNRSLTESEVGYARRVECRRIGLEAVVMAAAERDGSQFRELELNKRPTYALSHKLLAVFHRLT